MIDLNDPRLTAFALGELDDAEHQEIESAVQASPELQHEVAVIQQSAKLLQASLGAGACPSLTAAQRAAIEAESTSSATVQSAPKPVANRWSMRRAISLAFVASLLLVVVGGTAIVTLDLDRFTLISSADRHDAPQSLEEASTELAPAEGDMSSPAVDVRDFDGYEEPSIEAGLGNRAEDDSTRGLGESEMTPRSEPGRVLSFSAGKPAEEMQLREIEDVREAEPSSETTSEQGVQPRGRKALLGSEAASEGERPRRQTSQRLAMPEEAPFQSGLGRSGGELSGSVASDGPVIRSPSSGGPAIGEKSETSRGSISAASPVPTDNLSATDPAKPAENSVTRGGRNLSSDLSSVRKELERLDESKEQDLPMLLKKQSDGDPAGGDDGEDGASSDERSATARLKNKRNKAAKQADKTTWVRSRATPNASQLMIGDHDGLPLEGMQVNVLVDGFRARVLLDLYFFNNRGGRFEGNFKLRLPNEASLYYFAFGQSAYEYRPMVDQLASKGFLSGDLIRAASLDPRGIMRSREGSWTDVKEARVVPREKAAHAYSETVRRRVDPALVEWSGAGVFNARVFPLMPNKLHRVVVGYDVNLQQQGDDLVYALDLPVDQGECVVDLNVSAMPGVMAEVTPNARPFTSGGRAYYNFKDPEDQAISVRFKNAGSVLLTGADEPAGEFFVSRLTPKLPGDETNASSPRALFLLDTSLSSRPEKFNVWLDMLKAVLTENRDSMDEFAVLFFNIESDWWQDGFRKNNVENVDRLLADCHSLSLEGATDLRQALREATQPEWAKESAAQNSPRPDLFLLSDGAVTWGEMNVHRLSQTLQKAESGPLFAYQTGMTGTAVGMLEHLTRETGGAVFSVINESEIPQVARAHRQRPWQLVDVALPGGRDVLVAGRPKFIYPGQSLLVAGRGRPDAEATVRVRRGNQQHVVEVAIDRTLDSTLAPRVYGQVAVGQLEDLGSRVEDVAIAYARHFRVTGQTCSLLMLESEADYKRFNIKPQEDAFLVRTSPSADLITAKLDELADHLGNAKTELTDWLSKLERTPGLQFKVPTALRLVLDRLPRKAFEVQQARLVCSQRKNDDTPKELLRLLDSGRLDYNTVTSRAADRFEQLGPADALRTLSSLIGNNPGDPVLTRDVAFSALEWGLSGQAFHLLRRVSELRPYEPQTYQAMSLCLAETGNADLAMIYYEVALNATWHNRYLDVKQIVGVEYVDLLRRIERGELSSHAREYAVARLETMRGRVPVSKADLVITMMWNTDRTDVDLHVIEPTGEECYFEHPRTRMGGRMTRDVTEGFGPEMYTLSEAKTGDYRVLANYFGSDANRTNVRSKVYVTVYRNYGDPKRQWIERKTITLADQKEKRELTVVKVKE